MTDTAPLPAAPPPGRPRRRRWVVPPVLAGALVAGGVLVPRVASAQSAPSLPTISPQALVAKALSARPAHLSGTVQLTANLGLPDLSAFTKYNGASPSALSMLSGTHSASVWYGGPGEARLALPSGPGETDVVVNGQTVWVWQSQKYKATKVELPAHAAHPLAAAGMSMPTPDQVATELLSAIGSSTRVFVTDTAYVAGRPVYELGLAPEGAQTLVSDVLIAVDAGTGLPLRVQVLARNATEPALSVGFTQISFAAPAASNFSFTPPAGATVTTKDLASATPGRGWVSYAPLDGTSKAPTPPVTTMGKGWGTVAVLPAGALSAASASSSATGPAGDQISTLINSATAISGTWGSGRLLQTALVDALFLPDGRVLVGAVTPAALEAAAAHLG